MNPFSETLPDKTIFSSEELALIDNTTEKCTELKTEEELKEFLIALPEPITKHQGKIEIYLRNKLLIPYTDLLVPQAQLLYLEIQHCFTKRQKKELDKFFLKDSECANPGNLMKYLLLLSTKEQHYAFICLTLIQFIEECIEPNEVSTQA